MQTRHKLILLNPSISPDGVITGGGAPDMSGAAGARAGEPVTGGNNDTNVDDSNNLDTQQDLADKSGAVITSDDPEDANGKNGSKVTFEDFLNIQKSGDVKPKVEDKKELGDQTQQQQADDKQGQQQSQKADDGQQNRQQQQNHPNARDYTDIADEDKELFKNMSNKAFAKLKPVYIEHKKQAELVKQREAEIAELKKGGLPASYYEHENAYLLDKDYNQLEVATSYSDQVVNHWREQMALIEKGQDWNPIGWDNQNNRLVILEKRPANADGRIEALTYYQRALNNQSNLATQMNTLRSTYSAKRGEMMGALKATESGWFPQFQDDKSEMAVAAKDIQQKLPDYIRNSPLAGIIAKAVTLATAQANMIKELQSKVSGNGQAAGNGAAQQNGQQSQQQRRAGPTGADMGASGNSSKPGNQNNKAPSYDDFVRKMQVG